MSNESNKEFKGSAVLANLDSVIHQKTAARYSETLEEICEEAAKNRLEGYKEDLVKAFKVLKELQNSWKSIKPDLNEFGEDGKQIGPDKYSKAVLDKKTSAYNRLMKLEKAVERCSKLNPSNSFAEFTSAYQKLRSAL